MTCVNKFKCTADSAHYGVFKPGFGDFPAPEIAPGARIVLGFFPRTRRNPRPIGTQKKERGESSGWPQRLKRGNLDWHFRGFFETFPVETGRGIISGILATSFWKIGHWPKSRIPTIKITTPKGERSPLFLQLMRVLPDDQKGHGPLGIPFPAVDTAELIAF